MKIRDIMTTAVYSCPPDADLGAVAGIMWDHDCGCVPVVEAAGAVVGLITDRDICMAACMRGQAPGRMTAASAMSSSVRACLPDDSMSEGLAMMKHFKVRRLPVIDPQGDLVGMLSMNDIVRAIDAKKGLPAKDVVSALTEIGEHRTRA